MSITRCRRGMTGPNASLLGLLLAGVGACGPTVPDGGVDDASTVIEPEPGPNDGGAEPDVGTDGGRDAGPPLDGGADGGVDAGPVDAGPPCANCAGNETCCFDVCVDISADAQHCGACGQTCAEDQFCGGSPLCREATFSNLCESLQPYRLDDGTVDDVVAAARIGNSLVAACPNLFPTESRSQNDPNTLDQTTKRPLTGVNTMLIIAGGSFFQEAVVYLETEELLPVLSATSPETERLSLRNGSTIVDIPRAAVTDSHDFFVIQVASEPVSGTLVLVAYGMFTPGTAAAAYWLETEILPNLDTVTESYFVYEWSDQNGDEDPSPEDTFQLIASGN